MARIALPIERISHPPAAQIGYSLSTARVTAHFLLRSSGRWTPYLRGIIDTGAAVSLLPADVWKDAEYDLIGSVRIGGVVPRDECRVPAKLARLTCALSDGVQLIGPLNIHAYLAESDEVPLLLGVSDLIESGELRVAIRQNQATFEL